MLEDECSLEFTSFSDSSARKKGSVIGNTLFELKTVFLWGATWKQVLIKKVKETLGNTEISVDDLFCEFARMF